MNLGREDRFFLFINLELRDIVNAVSLQDNSDRWEEYGPNIVEPFMRQNPHYPVAKLKVKPGEAYIAPTENIIHDASTAGKSHQDFCITFLGKFTFKRTTRNH